MATSSGSWHRGAVFGGDGRGDAVAAAGLVAVAGPVAAGEALVPLAGNDVLGLVPDGDAPGRSPDPLGLGAGFGAR